MNSDHSPEIAADDSEQICSLIDRGDKEGLAGFLFGRQASVNTPLLLPGNKRTFSLHHAVDVPWYMCNMDIVQYLLDKGADCNIMDYKGYSPLHYSVIYWNIAAVNAVLNAGADVNLQADPPFPSREGRPTWGGATRRIVFNNWRRKKSFPLHLAVNECSAFPPSYPNLTIEKYDIIKLLISHGADCNLINGSNQAPLHYAVSQNDERLVTLLLDAGADVNITSAENNTTSPIFNVSQVSILKLLLSKNADTVLRPCSYRCTSLLHFFIDKGHTDLTEYLISDIDLCVETENDKCKSPLSVAVGKKDAETVHLLLSAGFSPDVNIAITDENRDLMCEVTEIASSPRPLVDLCTIKIRRILKRNINTSVQGLPLPTRLKDRITLANITGKTM